MAIDPQWQYKLARRGEEREGKDHREQGNESPSYFILVSALVASMTTRPLNYGGL